MRSSFIIVIGALFGTTAAVSVAHRARAADPLAALAPFRGTWEGTGETYPTPYSAAGSAGARTSCEWATNHGFLVCDQLVRMGGHTENDLSVYTYNDSTHSYDFFGISRRFPRARTPSLTITGRTWTYSSKFDDRTGNHVQIRTVNDVQDTVIAYRTEYTHDGGAHWTLMGKGGSRRVR